VLEVQNFVRSGTADLGGRFELNLGEVHETRTEQSADWVATEHLV